MTIFTANQALDSELRPTNHNTGTCFQTFAKVLIGTHFELKNLAFSYQSNKLNALHASLHHKHVLMGTLAGKLNLANNIIIISKTVV